MEYQDITLLECNREQSIQGKSNNDTQPSVFTCKLGKGLKLEAGDTVEIQSAFISEDGCGGGNMEFMGKDIYTDNGFNEDGTPSVIVTQKLDYTNLVITHDPQIVEFQHKKSLLATNIPITVNIKDNETTLQQRYYKTSNGEGCMFQPRRFSMTLKNPNAFAKYVDRAEKLPATDPKTYHDFALNDPQSQYPMPFFFEIADGKSTGVSQVAIDVANDYKIPKYDYFLSSQGGQSNVYTNTPTEKAQTLEQFYRPVSDNSRFTMFIRAQNYNLYSAAPNVKYWGDGVTDVNYLLDRILSQDWFAQNDYVEYIELKKYSVEEGFYSPTNVAAQITEQMQQNVNYVDSNGLTIDQPETLIAPITFEDGNTEDHNIFSATTTNSYKPIESGSMGRDDEETYDLILQILTEAAKLANPALYAPSDVEKVAITNYLTTMQYIFVKRPQLFTTGRQLNDGWGMTSTGTANFIINDISGVDVANNPPEMVTSWEYTTDNLNKISAFFKAQEQYAEELGLGLDRFIHVGSHPNIEYFGSDGLTTAPTLINGISQVSCPVFIRYDKAKENILNSGNGGVDNLSLGFATRKKSQTLNDGSVKDVIVLHPEITQSIQPNGWLATNDKTKSVLAGQPLDPSNNDFRKMVGNTTFVGFDHHCTAFSTVISTSRNGLAYGPPESFIDLQIKAVTDGPAFTKTLSDDYSTYVNSVDDYAVQQRNPTSARYNKAAKRITPLLNYRYIGANNPSLVFNELTNTFGFQNLHTAENVNQPFDAGRVTTVFTPAEAPQPATTIPSSTAISAEAATECYKINKRLRYNDYTPDMKPYWVKYPKHLVYVSGKKKEYLPVTLTDMENDTTGEVALKQDDAATDVSICNPNIEEGKVFDAHCGIFLDIGNTCPERYWTQSFWGLLGFTYEQFNPVNLNQNNNEQIRVGEENMFSMKYATTNCQVVTTDLKDYPITLFGGINYSTQIARPQVAQANNYAVPTAAKPRGETSTALAYPLKYTPYIVQNTQSITTRSQNIPKLMTRPYYTIRSDILDTEKYVGGDSGGIRMSIMGVVNKINGVSDFYFTDGGGVALTITHPITLTDVTTAICDPSGKLANVDDNSAVIYKVSKNKNTSRFDIVKQIMEAQNQQK